MLSSFAMETKSLSDSRTQASAEPMGWNSCYASHHTADSLAGSATHLDVLSDEILPEQTPQNHQNGDSLVSTKPTFLRWSPPTKSAGVSLQVLDFVSSAETHTPLCKEEYSTPTQEVTSPSQANPIPPETQPSTNSIYGWITN